MADTLHSQPIDEPGTIPPTASSAQAANSGSRNDDRYRNDEFDAPLYKSIRFRLTAWYAAALILVIVGLSVSIHVLLVRSLSMDAESRLGNAVLELKGNISLALPPTGPQNLAVGAPLYEITTSGVDSIVLSGLWFQVFDTTLELAAVGSSSAPTTIPEDLERALGDENVFNRDRNTFLSIEVGGVNSMVLIAPFFQTERGTTGTGPLAGWFIVGEPIGSRDNMISLVDQVLRLFGVVGVALAVWGGWIMAGRALAPVGRITETAESIASRDGSVSLSQRLAVPDTGDELSRLAHTFNGMLDRIQEAFIVQRRFVGDASHELRTPLTSVRGHVDVLLRQLKSDRASIDKEDLVEELRVVQLESGRMGRLIDDMLVLARSDASNHGELLKMQAVSIEVLAREAFRTASHLATGQRLLLTIDEAVTMLGDGDRLVQVMINLMDNAIRHTPADGTVELKVGRDVDPIEGEWCASIQVVDSGSGIRAEHVPHLFERFYRAENARSRASGGTGLGLPIALAIIRGHRGWIDIDTAAGEGTIFTVWLPLTVPASVEPGDVSPGVSLAVDMVKRGMRTMRYRQPAPPPDETTR